ncbi:MAG TPA: nitroreductase family deazaflavin-dependent oxidoreductase [Jatrophihabitantaceae bacterium]|jgi:deazaflavin-dependent oxidoreductase (nitroreductase family)|nr:nitroreductase family deazaflavin-dependent oxidoreductase [Jatrophihabitantaceae bacterium]
MNEPKTKAKQGPKPKPTGLDRPSTLKIIKVMSAVHTKMYRVTGGRLGKKWRIGSAVRKGVPICLVTTIGRKSGQPRTAPLCFMADGERIILVASQGGTPTNPQWYYNILANPGVEVRIGRRTQSMSAHAANADERAVLWPRLVELYADYASYQSWTDREIPVVICEPAA